MKQLYVLVSCLGVMAGSATAQTSPTGLRATYNMYGVPGLLEMPTAQMAPDGELAFTFSYAGETLRNTLTFQVGKRLTGSFRYTKIDDFDTPSVAPLFGTRYDRSFDLRYQFLTEGKYRPAMAVGLQDIIGTGLYAGEYVAATKTFGPVVATAGLGWGRLGSYNSFSNPLGVISDSFNTRPAGTTGLGGQFETAKWFRGPAAAFAGVSWAVNDRMTLKAEYSSDAHIPETTRGHFTHKSPLNFGLDYQLRAGTQISAYALYGSEVGILANFTFNPNKNPNGLAGYGAPLPILPRAQANATDLGWSNAPKVAPNFVTALAPILKEDGIILEGIDLNDTTATVRIANTRYGAQAQAVGHVARLLSNVMPQSVDTFVVVPMVKGLAGSKVIIPRDALERYENTPDGAAQILAASRVMDAADVDRRANLNDAFFPKFTYSFGPYVDASLFDPNNPIALNAGLELSAKYTPTPGLILSTNLRHRMIDNYDAAPRFSDSVIDHVRSDVPFYNRADGIVVEHLTAAYLFRPGRNLYGRVTAGYLERMYGGVSSELLWKPVGSRFALGAELNYVKQRSFEGLGFAPLTITNAINNPAGVGPGNPPGTGDHIGGPRSYEVLTGHISAYYKLSNNFHAQLDVGRYLGKDWGATFSLDREFNNGWKVGAYATITDVPFDDFGEGSFDKGIRITIPTSWQIGSATRHARNTVVQPLLRDGGARLNVQDRLYGLVRDTHKPQLEARWGRFWR